METAIILAGGFGTRLAAVVSDVPKPMAPVAGRPFLERLLDRLIAQGIRRVVLAVGHKKDIIRNHFGATYKGVPIQYSEENEPLGTGGAILQAFVESGAESALVFNGDTYCTLNLNELSAAHQRGGAKATLALVPVDDAGRYGEVQLDAANRIVAFREKNPEHAAGLINAGIYALNRSVFDLVPGQIRFSFEQAVLQAHAATEGFVGHIAQGAIFIDIGVPEDYYRAQTLLGNT